MKHRKGVSSTNIKDLEIPQTVFNPLCHQKYIPSEVVYNRFSNHTFSLESAPLYDDTKPSNPAHLMKPMRQPGFPLIIELKSRRSRPKSKSKPKLSLINMPYKPKIEGHSTLSPVYSNMHGKVIYVMSAKLLKKVTITFPKSILGAKDYPHPTVESDVTVDVKEQVIHKKKKVKPSEELGIYDKEYNTTSEYRRMKGVPDDRVNESKQEDMEVDQTQKDDEQDEDVDKDKEGDKVKEEKQEELNPESDKPDETPNAEDSKEGDKENQPETANLNAEGEKNEKSDQGDKSDKKDEESKDTTQANEKQDEDDESDEEYNGEGCFIGYKNTDALRNLIVTPMQRFNDWSEKLNHFKFITPKVRVSPLKLSISKVSSSNAQRMEYEDIVYKKVMSHKSILTSLKYTNSLYFPHRNLVQYDCGKLHKLSQLLKSLKANDSKVLIFTQMTKMLNLLEQFLNLHGYTYIRLDGSVKVEMRQKLVDNFNLNKKIF